MAQFSTNQLTKSGKWCAKNSHQCWLRCPLHSWRYLCKYWLLFSACVGSQFRGKSASPSPLIRFLPLRLCLIYPAATPLRQADRHHLVSRLLCTSISILHHRRPITRCQVVLGTAARTPLCPLPSVPAHEFRPWPRGHVAVWRSRAPAQQREVTIDLRSSRTVPPRENNPPSRVFLLPCCFIDPRPPVPSWSGSPVSRVTSSASKKLLLEALAFTTPPPLPARVL